MQKKIYSCEWAGKTLSAEFTDLADQTNGSVMIRYGATVVLGTVVMSKHDKEGLEYFPLTVDYDEKFYASGQILGSQYVRREGRPTEEAILRGRIVDRTIRPLFPSHIRRDVHVVITTLAIDQDDPDVLAVLAASLSLAISDIPWNGPVGAVRISRKSGSTDFEINPTFSNRPDDEMDIEMICCGKEGNINMIEVGAKEISEADIAKAFDLAATHLKVIEDFQHKIIAELGKTKQEFVKEVLGKEEIAYFNEIITPKIDAAVFSGPGGKEINALKDEWLTLFAEKFPEGKRVLAEEHYEEIINEVIHKEAILNQRRADGRGLDEVRPLFAQAGGISEALHGTGIFYRGGTHIFSALTLGGPEDAMTLDTLIGVEKKRHFMLHYNFPPFSSGETGRIEGTNRRMIGHGALAEKALRAVVPERDVFPYTIRIVSESMASNGSTSMGSVCAGTLALMDGGVPITAPVAGIASGLMMETPEHYALLTDIQGPEDHHGDMDFKVAGTTKGVTAIQMDVKVGGIPIPILVLALEKARLARLHILKTMLEALPEARKDISPRAPKIVVLKINKEQIGLVIGSGGKTINEIREKTGTEITIEDDGVVYITGKNGGAEKAKAIIEAMTHEYRAGEKVMGTITKIVDFGAFVKFGFNNEGLVHISEIAPFRIEVMGNHLKEGMEVPLVIKGTDERGKIALSIKQADATFAEKVGFAPKAAPEQKN
jgi:polyribonucleotide nucleotidyltransferase